MPADILGRFVFGTLRLEDLNKALRAIDGRAVTVVIARELKNTCIMILLLALYAAAVDKAPLITTHRYHADFSKFLMYNMSTEKHAN